jgi:Xaa-Pro aminopeptidase
MVDVGLLDGEVDTLINEEAYRRYYMHGTGHWLGLDVHDAGAYHVEGASRPLEPGMVLTVEPGLYIPPDDERAPAEYRGIGIRIEDDVLVTGGDPEVLTAACPKRVDELEAICGG